MADPKKIKLDVSNYIVSKKEVLYPVLPDHLIEDTPLMEVYVGSIRNPKNISKVILELNTVLPLPDLIHLKRIKGREIIVVPVNYTEEEKIFSILAKSNLDVDVFEKDLRIVKVAKVAPLTRRQWEKIHQLWPCNFHANKHLEKLMTNTLFTAKELLDHKKYMRIALDVVEYAKKHIYDQTQVGCVIVDPKLNSVVAVGYQKTNEGPCRHAAMVAIDNVAKTQGGGAWDTEKCEEKPGEADLSLRGIPPALLQNLKDKYTGCFGARRYKKKEELSEPTDGPYLCTNYYVYLTREACVMCAMALIHSRAKMVFYGAKSLKGALGSLCKIHTVKDLNHHYEVFGGLLEDECLAS